MFDERYQCIIVIKPGKYYCDVTKFDKMLKVLSNFVIYQVKTLYYFTIFKISLTSYDNVLVEPRTLLINRLSQ